MSRLTRALAAAAALTLGLTLTACGSAGTTAPVGSPSAGATTTPAANTAPLKVLADVKPHAELIKEAQKQGLLGDVKIELREITGDVDVNQLTQAGDIDANFFQHVPYLTDWNKQHSGTLVSVGGVHIEPLGLYSKKVATVADTPDKAVIAIPLDATNQGRALFLLADAGLLKLNVTKDSADISQVTEKNITENPKNITFKKIDRPQLAATLDDPAIQLSVVNGNYAIEAGLTPSKDAKFLEKAENNPYVNVLVTTEKLKNDARVQKLAQALTSAQIKAYIEATYSGSVLPAVQG